MENDEQVDELVGEMSNTKSDTNKYSASKELEDSLVLGKGNTIIQ